MSNVSLDVNRQIIKVGSNKQYYYNYQRDVFSTTVNFLSGLYL